MRVSYHYDQVFKFYHYYWKHLDESWQNQNYSKIRNLKNNQEYLNIFKLRQLLSTLYS